MKNKPNKFGSAQKMMVMIMNRPQMLRFWIRLNSAVAVINGVDRLFDFTLK